MNKLQLLEHLQDGETLISALKRSLMMVNGFHGMSQDDSLPIVNKWLENNIEAEKLIKHDCCIP